LQHDEVRHNQHKSCWPNSDFANNAKDSQQD
jgi:hypothetical protein